MSYPGERGRGKSARLKPGLYFRFVRQFVRTNYKTRQRSAPENPVGDWNHLLCHKSGLIWWPITATATEESSLIIFTATHTTSAFFFPGWEKKHLLSLSLLAGSRYLSFLSRCLQTNSSIIDSHILDRVCGGPLVDGGICWEISTAADLRQRRRAGVEIFALGLHCAEVGLTGSSNWGFVGVFFPS